VYEAHGELMAVTTMKVPLVLPCNPTFADYAARPPAPNVEAVVPLNFSSGFSGTAADDAAKKAQGEARARASGGAATAASGREGSGRDSRDSANGEVSAASSAAGATEEPILLRQSPSKRRSFLGRKAKHRNDLAGDGTGKAPHARRSTNGSTVGSVEGSAQSAHAPDGEGLPGEDNVLRTRIDGTGRKMKARLWLASKVPINQRQLLPLLEIIGTQNQYIGKVRMARMRLLCSRNAGCCERHRLTADVFVAHSWTLHLHSRLTWHGACDDLHWSP
jgi:hypothetical protein